MHSTRHILRSEDSTNVCSTLLSRPTKQCRAGGLPLNFHKDVEEEDSDGSLESQGYLLDYSDGIQMVSTEDSVEQRLSERSKTYESEAAPQLCTGNVIMEPLEDECDGAEDDQEEPFMRPTELPQRSLAEILLDRLGETSEENELLQSFAHFEATEGTTDGRQFLILFPFAHSENGGGVKIKISVIGSTMVKDFIGLCCLVYSRSGNAPNCSDPSNYELYLADENFDVDTFLPPLDENRAMMDCGFPTLALLSKQNGSCSQTHTITIHLVNKSKFTIEASSLDLPLQWLLDEALVIKRDKSKGHPNVGVEREYILETLAGHRVPLELTNTIESVKTLDFVLLRKNSSRGDLATSRTSSDPNSSAPELGSSPSKSPKSRTPEYKRQASTLWEDVPDLEPSDDVLRQYTVERVHRLKPKTHSLLLFRENSLEIVPLSSERRLNIVLPHSAAKPLSIDWDYVGGVEIAERTSSKRIMKVVWLPVPDSLHQFFTSCSSSDLPSPISLQFPAIDFEANDTMLRHFYETVNWKTLQLEVSAEDVFKIANEINDIVEPRDSKIRRLYHHSGGGSRKPGAVSDTFLASLSPSLSSSTPTTPVPKARKKISIVPVLTRMLSKHEQTST
ncbi:hypothetical protein QR680_001543 [Steinernema hermaphroditum]|uniref:Target of rapamycin complex 2 subunit MAPKAP1 n=1 Tax=Steinernema hermaphroditum TaxID=289476 RepID=A0AA39LG55_9BILA|nr:hypothetical protein QR680_001543 [Steinernema hermaphroditum]